MGQNRRGEDKYRCEFVINGGERSRLKWAENPIDLVVVIGLISCTCCRLSLTRACV